MKLRKLGRYLAGFLAMVALLGFSTTVLALPPAYEIWSGPFSFTLTMTDRNAAGKLVKTTQTVTGTVNMYVIPDGDPNPGPNGYVIEFIDSQSGKLAVGFKGLEIVSTKIPTSKSMKIMGVGAGQFLQGAPPVPVGPAYCSLSGTVALDAPGGIPTSITATMTMGGGSPTEGPNGDRYIWSGKPKLVLHKQ
jgi:hypothetical protein